MIIDCHAHCSAPQILWAYRALLLASRGVDGPGRVEMSDADIIAALHAPEIGRAGHLDLMDDHGIGLQLVSPRPNHLMHSEQPERIIHWFHEQVHALIHRQVQLFPDRFRGVAALPLCAGQPVANALPELERCVTTLGFVGALVNPDPFEQGRAGESAPLGDRFWYPLWEKLCELDVPALIHATTSRSPRLGYSLHMINEESMAIVNLLDSDVFTDFPSLKIIIPHGGGAIPYQLGRFDAASVRKGGTRFRDRMRNLYYDTVLYTPEAIALLIRTVGVDRCLYAQECPGVGAVVDPLTGRDMDDTAPQIDAFDFLSAEEKAMIFEGNARKVFRLDHAPGCGCG